MSPSNTMSLQSIEPDNFFGGGKIDAFDARARGEPGNILRRRQPLRALLQVFGDTLRHQFERQLAALVLTVQPNDMETVARRDRLRADRTGRKREQGLLEFRRGLADCDLAKVAALRSRWARRVRLRQFGELLGMLMQVAREMWALTARELQRVQEHSLVLIKSAEERVAGFLLEMADRVPTGATVELPMSRQDIADYLGLTIETVSRTLKLLEDAAAIEVAKRRRILLRNRSALRRLNA
jgi:DNA-binding transcriptional ArsR family regulator